MKPLKKSSTVIRITRMIANYTNDYSRDSGFIFGIYSWIVGVFQHNTDKMNIVLTGFMASGKTVIGRKLAKKLGMKFIDTDILIERKSDLKIHKIFSSYGEPYFRNLESDVIAEVNKRNNQVIAVGGGAVLRAENRKNLSRNGLIINLKISAEAVFRRVKEDKTVRPLLRVANPRNKIKELLQTREPYYQKCDFRINVSGLEPEKVVEKIIAYLNSL